MTERFNKLEELRKTGASDTEILNALVCAMSDVEFEDNVSMASKLIEHINDLKDIGYFDSI